MKIIKCGKIDDYNYCIVRQKYKSQYGQIYLQFELFVDITNDESLKKWFKKHTHDKYYRCNGISKGVPSVGMNGKVKHKFKDRTFARFNIDTTQQNDVLENVNYHIERFCEFKIMTTLEGLDFEIEQEQTKEK